MKNTTWIASVFVSLALTVPAFAQQGTTTKGKITGNAAVQAKNSALSGKIERLALQAEKKFKQQKKAKKVQKCFRCGRAITEETRNSKCPADCDVYCTSISGQANGNEPECGPIYIEVSSKQAQGGGTEPEFFVVNSCDREIGPNGGEPSGNYYEEVDPGLLYKAEELLQQDRDAHNGYVQHSLEYYYQKVSGKGQNNAVRCVRCGEEVRAGQHCSATGYTTLCTASSETRQNEAKHNPYFKGGDPHNAANYETCIHCGQPITDERLNTKCPADCDVYCTAASAPAEKQVVRCVRCGEEVRAGQHCSATGYTTLCTASSETRQNAAQHNPYFKGGDPHNAANYEKCFRCGQPITDERLNRKCPSDCDVRCTPASKADASKHTCYRCGKSFRAGQHCSATGYTTLCANSAKQEQELKKAEAQRKQEAEKASVCPKCGKHYTIDEIYHGLSHSCQD